MPSFQLKGVLCRATALQGSASKTKTTGRQNDEQFVLLATATCKGCNAEGFLVRNESESNMPCTTQQVMTFVAECDSCKRSFGIPLACDFSYGEQIFYGSGNTFAYLQCLENQEWQDATSEIEKILKKVTGQKKLEGRQTLRRIGELTERLADPIDRFPYPPSCPHCGSSSVSYSDATPLGSVSMPIAAWRTFLAMPDAEKERQVTARWLESEPRP